MPAADAIRSPCHELVQSHLLNAKLAEISLSAALTILHTDLSRIDGVVESED